MSLDMADLKPTVLTAVTLFLLILVVVPLGKYVLNRWPVPGLTDLANAI